MPFPDMDGPDTAMRKGTVGRNSAAGCVTLSFDFEKNEAQVAFSGRVSKLVKDPETRSQMQGKTTHAR